jgi:hypothetical protein
MQSTETLDHNQELSPDLNHLKGGCNNKENCMGRVCSMQMKSSFYQPFFGLKNQY